MPYTSKAPPLLRSPNLPHPTTTFSAVSTNQHPLNLPLPQPHLLFRLLLPPYPHPPLLPILEPLPLPPSSPRPLLHPSTSSARTATRPANRLGATSSFGNAAARPAKLGAKKAATNIDFEEAERKAKAEEERIKKLGYDAQREAEEERTRRAAASLANASSASASVSTKPPVPSTSSPSNTASAPATSNVNSSDPAKQPSQDVERLGIGFKRMGFGATPGPSTSSSSRKPTVDNTPTTAREKFGNQKAISSEMYFERGSYDPNVTSEAKQKLQQFQGATSISSNQYFGRDEEPEDPTGSGSFTGNESISALENATRDAISRVMANPDVQNAADSIRAGALKVNPRACALDQIVF